MPLQVKRAGLDEYGSSLKVLLAGEPGVGKTRIASCFPNVLYANAEGGLMSVVDRRSANVDIGSASDLNELLTCLRQPPGKREAEIGAPVETVVIDTLDEMQRILIRERLTDTKKESLVIQDYGWLGDQLRGMVRAFRNLDLNVIFCLHLKSDKDEESGRTYIKPQLVGAMADEIAAYMDMALLMKVTQTTRVVEGRSQRVEQRLMQTSSDANHTWIKDRSGKLPKPEFEIDLTGDYTRITAWLREGLEVQPTEQLGVIGSHRSATAAPVAPPKGPAKVTAATKNAAGIKAAPTAKAAPAPPVRPTVEAPASVVTATAVVVEESVPATETVESSNGNGSERPLPVDGPLTPPRPAHMEPVPEAEVPGPAGEAEAVPVQAAVPECVECHTPVTDVDQQDLSKIRFRKVYCRDCFRAAKKK